MFFVWIIGISNSALLCSIMHFIAFILPKTTVIIYPYANYFAFLTFVGYLVAFFRKQNIMKKLLDGDVKREHVFFLILPTLIGFSV